ncbi:MAG TPA: hypothetical protein VFV81_02540 [Verrucomicrobiae bacterium]|nr:hypothetical protein [Verrucomicrobiae bacterium]
MKDLAKPFWIYLKAVLFLLVGAVSVILILLGNPNWRTAVLLAAAIWSFCRAYYFAFTSSKNMWIRNTAFPG